MTSASFPLHPTRANRLREAIAELHPGTQFLPVADDVWLVGVARPRPDMPSMAVYLFAGFIERMEEIQSADVLFAAALEGEEDSAEYWKSVMGGMVHIANTNPAVLGTIEYAPTRPDLELPVGMLDVAEMYVLGAKLFQSSPVYQKEGKKLVDLGPSSTNGEMVERNLLDKSWGVRGPVFMDLVAK